MKHNPGFIQQVLSDGRPLLSLSGIALIGAGLFAILQAASGHFLPHDEAFLGMSARDLCAIHECRIVHFMIHDRVSFGGAIAAIGILYLWLVMNPIARKEPWAWWSIAISGVIGFGSFLTFLSYGYLDSWHGIATLLLLLIFVTGLARSYRSLNARTLQAPSLKRALTTRGSLSIRTGRACLLGVAVGLFFGGLVIMCVGMTVVFVPQDTAYMGLQLDHLNAINPRLVPLIAHDRASFGGAVCCYGWTLFCCVWHSRWTKSLWQAIFLSGLMGFSTGIGIHPLVGYNDVVHLAPACAGALAWLFGLVATYRICLEYRSTRSRPVAIASSPPTRGAIVRA